MEGSNFDQAVVFSVLGLALFLFALGPIRYDVVALLALLAVTLTGVIPARDAFSGFGHPSVVTVAAVLVLSSGLQQAGVVNAIARPLGRLGEGATRNILVLCVVVAVLSAFMNNVGALALMIPVAIRRASVINLPPSAVLMPLAFSSLLGGLTTLIGTPPNIIISGFYQEQTGTPFRMFDFAPVGVAVALAGVLFMGLGAWRLVPRNDQAAADGPLFEIERYLSEVRVMPGTRGDGALVRDIETGGAEQALIVGILRDEERMLAPPAFDTVRAGDVLTIESEPETLGGIMDRFGLEFTGEEVLEGSAAGHLSMIEAVVLPASPLASRTVHDVQLRTRFGVNLLAVAGTGIRAPRRLSRMRLTPGDIVLLQGPEKSWREALRLLGCAPLRSEPEIPERAGRRVGLALGIFAAAIIATAFGWVTAPVAFAAAAVAMVLTRILGSEDAYPAIDWPVIILLGAMLPVGSAFESSGAAARIAEFVADLSSDAPAFLTLLLLLVVTMALSNVLNNAATALLMAPVALALSVDLEISSTALLMAVAVGASSPFMTPIGHQSNTLVLGPGGYAFNDFWRLGLPLQIIVAVVAVPAIMIVWPP